MRLALALCSNGCMDDPLIAAFRSLCDRVGGFKAVATKIDANDQSLYQVYAGVRLPSGRPKGVGPKLRERLDAAYPGWQSSASTLPPLIKNDETDHAPLVAHGMSLDIHTVPPTVRWEDLMELERSKKLPAAFRLVMKDNAMSPIAGAGATVEFSTAREGQVGDAVLVMDAQGRHYFREMCELADGWEARPTNPAFARLNSRDHGLTIIAVFAGVARVGSWSDLAR